VIPEPKPAWWPLHLEVAGASVRVAELAVELQAFLAAAAAMHFSYFRSVLVVTSGNDGPHAAGSKHFLWRAVDIRSLDLTVQQQNSFVSHLIPLQEAARVGIFDERFIGQPHWHVETA